MLVRLLPGRRVVININELNIFYYFPIQEEYTASTDKDGTDHYVLEDYRPVDPSPSSKASIRPGPIQHGTPLMPYIPKPSPPPGHPKDLGLP